METITNLIKDTPIPKMVKVRQNFDKTCIPESDIPGIITRELDRPEIGGKIQPGQKIAITCGSRGINHNAVMARAIVDFVKSKGAEPYIVASMGSHGGATAEGQTQILKDYGVTEEAMGCPVKSSFLRFLHYYLKPELSGGPPVHGRPPAVRIFQNRLPFSSKGRS